MFLIYTGIDNFPPKRNPHVICTAIYKCNLLWNVSDRNQYVQNAVRTVQLLVIGLESMFSLGRGFEGQAKTCTIKFTGELQSVQVSTPSQLSHNEMLKPSPRDMQPFYSCREMDILIDMHRRLNTSLGYRTKISLFHYGWRHCCKIEGLLVLSRLLDGIKIRCLLMVTELHL